MPLDPVTLLEKKPNTLCDVLLSEFVKLYMIREVNYEKKV